MKKNILILASILFIITLFASCYYDKEDILYATRPNQQSGTCDTTNVTYNLTITPIFASNCIGCHGSGSSFNFNGYGALSSYLASNSQKLLDDINYTGTKQMPPSTKLSDCYLKQIRIWIQANYPNN